MEMEREMETPTKQQQQEEQQSPTPISRWTRSHAAPDWTVREMLTLANEIAAVEEDCRKALSSYQKWKIISDNCIALDVVRPSHQCRRKWDSMLSDYLKIKAWESLRSSSSSTNGGGAGFSSSSYWCMDDERRKESGLPVSFDRELFGSIACVLKVQAGRPDPTDVTSESEGVSDEAGGMQDGDEDVVMVDSGSKKARHTNKSEKNAERMKEMACKLQENAQHIHAILRGELSEDDASRSPALVDLSKPNAIETELTRRQADELIKALGSLVSGVDRFTEMVQEGGCVGIRPMNSTTASKQLFQ